jgi:hypothetical protein
MDRMTLVNTILFLRPGAKFSVWETNDIKKYYGEDRPLSRFNMFVDWNKQNTVLCPSEEEIKNANPKNVVNYHEKLRKEERDNSAKNNIAIKSGYFSYLEKNPGSSFTDYMDKLESLKI